MTKSKSTKYCIGCVAMTFMVYTVFSMAAGNSLFAENHGAATASEKNHINWVTSDKRSSIDRSDKSLPAGSSEDQEMITAAKSLSLAFRSISKRVLPTIVAIENKPRLSEQSRHSGKQRRQATFDPQMQNPTNRNSFYGSSAVPFIPRGIGAGSGVIVDAGGLILTNNHVVQGDGIITVRLHDGREFAAGQVWGDPKTDVALIKIATNDRLPVAAIGNSDKAQVGDWVLALGQPFGLESTVTAGIISAKGRAMGINDREDYLQTDAAINPGNSGGPLVDLDGRIIGINTAISSRDGGNDGVGFAVPINLAKWVADELVDDGIVQRAFLGVGIQAVTQALADQFNIPPRTGLLITQVLPGSPAQAAGVQDGDILVEFAGQKVNSTHKLQMLVERSEIGQRYGLVVLRDGKRLKLEYVARHAKSGQVNRAGPSTGSQTEPTAYDDLGLQVESMDSDVAQRLNLSNRQGVVITGVQSDSPAAASGLATGMVIAKVQHSQIHSAADFGRATHNADLDNGVLMLVRSEVGSRFLVVKK
ncbi:MAG: Do family serine endopeptidase [Mariniblastus sp.]|nr:Do family serine endopeptidase [Mariniblastus sp.]